MHIILEKIRDDQPHTQKLFVKMRYGTLFEGMSMKHGISKYYHVFILLRGFTLVFLVVFFETHPLLQIIPLILINLLLVYALFKYQMFENTHLNFINKIKEVMITFAKIFIMLLYFDYDSDKYPQAFGWLIISFLGIAMITELIYIIYRQFKEAIAQFRKDKRLRSSVSF